MNLCVHLLRVLEGGFVACAKRELVLALARALVRVSCVYRRKRDCARVHCIRDMCVTR